MKKRFVSILAVVSTLCLLSGCVGGLNLGGGSKTVVQKPTMGQQLVDLKKARDAGAINDVEYQNQRAELLKGK